MGYRWWYWWGASSVLARLLDAMAGVVAHGKKHKILRSSASRLCCCAFVLLPFAYAYVEKFVLRCAFANRCLQDYGFNKPTFLFFPENFLERKTP
jgi:hypothetical protein